MKKVLLLSFASLLGTAAIAQDLPSNPEAGKCYVRCKTPDVWKNEDVTIQVAPAYKKMSVNPAQYESETFTVIGKEAGKTLEVVPAEYKNENFDVVIKEPSYSLEVIQETKSTVTETVVVEEASYRLEVVPAVYESKSYTVVTRPSYKKLEVVPAQYETRNETIVCQSASKRLELIPGEWGTETVSYRKKEFGTTLSVVPATFRNENESIEVKAASAQWQMSERAPDCQSDDPNDCRYWCYKEVPAQYTTVTKTLLDQEAKTVRNNECNDPDCGQGTYTKKLMVRKPTTRAIDIPEVVKTYKKTVMVTPPSTREVVVPEVIKTFTKRVMVTPPTTRKIEIPAKTKEITKTVVNPATTRKIEIPAKTKSMVKTVLVSPATTREFEIPSENKTLKRTKLVKDAWVSEQTVDAKYTTVSKEVLVTKGGLTTWKEVDCKLTENSVLPINWNLGSATLTSEAKRIIDQNILSVANQGVSVQIASHTDSRGTSSSNQALSERRAQAVVNYLISKGINSSQLVANGYGETRLTNRCSDGVSCTEREHLQNRRTTFRVLNQ